MSIAQKLLQLTSIIYSSQNVTEILHVMIDAVASEITSADLVGCFVRENEYVFRGSFTNVASDMDFIQTLTIDIREDSFARQIVEMKRPAFVPDVRKDGRLDPEKIKVLSIQSIFGLPLLVDQDVYALVFVHNKGKTMRLTQEQRSVAESLITVAGIAIHNIHVLKRQTLRNEFSNSISACKTIAQISEICSDYVRQIVGPTIISVHLLDVKSMHTSAVFVSREAPIESWELNNYYKAGLEQVKNHPIFMEVIASQKCVFIPNTVGDHRINQALCEQFDIQSLLVMPLREKDTVVGLITIPGTGIYKKYREEDIAYLQSMADTAGVAISNIIHSNELEQLVSMRTEELQQMNSQLQTTVVNLEMQEMRLRGLVNAMPLSIILVDENGKWLEANNIAIEFFGLHSVPYRFQTGNDLGPHCNANGDIMEKMTSRNRLVHVGDKPLLYEDEYRRPDGSILIYKTYLCPISRQTEKLHGIICIGEDVSEQRRIQEILDRSEKLALVGQLAAGVAHEIRNPLTSLRGFIQLLKEDGANQRHCDVMLSELDRLNAITNEFLFLAKPTLPNMKYCDSKAILFEVILLFQTQTLLQNIELEFISTISIPLLFCDNYQLKQVLINLLTNATEAMPTGGKLIVSMLFSDDDTNLIIRIADSGSGISPDRLKRMGEPFYTTKEKGTGLGLMICFKIMELHGGRLEIKSEVDRGTVIDVMIPIARQ